jgi:CDP-glycerol glycerophosphotransferase (TagB/SpsB family)
LFFDRTLVDATRRKIRDAWGIEDTEVLTVVAPTFRGNGQRSAYEANGSEWGLLRKKVVDSVRLVFRAHPFSGNNEVPVGYIDGSSIDDMSDLLMAADVLVTDYSSSIFEFALLGRPSILFTPDLEEYERARSFYFDIDSYAYSGRVDDVDSLAERLNDPSVAFLHKGKEFGQFVERFVSALDGFSTRRVVEQIERGMA